jgi:hypothetical protein
MPKTSSQLNREIAGALEDQDTVVGDGDFYYVSDRGADRTIYGPYATRRDAEMAGYFHKPVTDRDSVALNLYFPRGVQEYTTDELQSLVRSPEEWTAMDGRRRLESVRVVRRSPPLHASWKRFDAEFRQHIRDEDRDLADRLSSLRR